MFKVRLYKLSKNIEHHSFTISTKMLELALEILTKLCTQFKNRPFVALYIVEYCIVNKSELLSTSQFSPDLTLKIALLKPHYPDRL